MNRKGVVFNWLVVLIATITLSALFVFLVLKENRVSQNRQLGDREFGLYHSYHDLEEFRLFLDFAGEYAAERASLLLAWNGGFTSQTLEDSPCGITLNGTPLWLVGSQSGDTSCAPDYRYGLASRLDEALDGAFDDAGFPKPGFTYAVEGGDLLVYATASNFLAQDLSTSGVTLIPGWPSAGLCVRELDWAGMSPTSYSGDCPPGSAGEPDAAGSSGSSPPIGGAIS
ncbi:hypothetical protein J4439_03565 [Candidatus Woesearchaeota archaeon]|nr:hypothetical protein [Candidatus Woesearchaeota archaeon]